MGMWRDAVVVADVEVGVLPGNAPLTRYRIEYTVYLCVCLWSSVV